MSKDIEVEISGPLSKEKNAELMEFFDKNGKKTNVKHRVLIDYSTFLGDGLKNRKKDIRLRITNGKPEIIVKLGEWNSSNHRKELSVFTEAGSFDRLVQIYAALAYIRHCPGLYIYLPIVWQQISRQKVLGKVKRHIIGQNDLIIIGGRLIFFFCFF